MIHVWDIWQGKLNEMYNKVIIVRVQSLTFEQLVDNGHFLEYFDRKNQYSIVYCIVNAEEKE